MEPRQRDELEFVPHPGKLALEDGNRLAIELLPPVERERAVVGQHLAWEPGMDSIGKAFRLVQVRLRCLTPDEITLRRIGEPTCDSCIQPTKHVEEPFRRPFEREEWVVHRVNVAGNQMRSLGKRLRSQDWNVHICFQ